ncbi:MAG: Gfo/Idh/MocA family protein [Hyphomicrobiales bacterium]
MDKIRLIHVGLGRWGFDWARDVLPGHPDVEAVAYVDGDGAALRRAQKELGAPPDACFADIATALRRVASDAVVVCLPTAFHAPVARLALEADRHVVVEKPFTATMREAHDLVGLAEARRRVLMVSQNYRYFPASVAAAEFVRKGDFGKLCQIKIDFRRNAVVEGHGYLGLANPLLVDMAVHHFDLMRMIIGEDPAELSCRTWNPRGSPFTGDACGAIVLTFPSGVAVSYRGSWLDQGAQTAWAGEWQMDFEHGSVLWTSRGSGPEGPARDRVATKRPNAEAETRALPAMRLYGRRGVLAAFATAIRTGREPVHFPSGRSNIATLAVIEAALESSALAGTSVRIADVLATENSAKPID